MISPLDALRQTDTRHEFDAHGKGIWTIVYKSWRGDDGNGAYFSAFAPKRRLADLLANTSWDFGIGDGLPGFMKSFSNDRSRTSYLRYGNTRGLEPIVLLQEHHGVKPRQLPQVSEEFRLFHNLWVPPQGDRLIRVSDGGGDETAVEIRDYEVRIRTKLLRQFQAARQLVLVLYVDSVRFVDGVDSSTDYDALSEEAVGPDRTVVFHASGDRVVSDDRPFSRFLAKKVVLPPQRKKAGVWPYNEDEVEHYPEFVIGEDEDGTAIRHTCNPDLLANFFGTNPDAPHYLTSVFFERDVLRRYYEQPEKYAVEDGYLRCGSLWGMRIDNDSADHVMVFLGDLGRDLPESERDYWRAFNEAPIGTMSLTNYRRSFLAEGADATAPDLQFKRTYTLFRRAWEPTQGWQLFRDPEESDEHVFQGLRLPLTESHPEFEGQILSLAKLLVDALNEGDLLAQLGGIKVKDEKGIGKLDRWLQQAQYAHAPRDIDHLRKVQRLRSRAAAHLKGSDYKSLIEIELGHGGPIVGLATLFEASTLMLRDLAQHFGVDLYASY